MVSTFKIYPTLPQGHVTKLLTMHFSDLGSKNTGKFHLFGSKISILRQKGKPVGPNMKSKKQRL